MTLFAPRSLLAALYVLLWPVLAPAQTLQTNTGPTSLNQINVTTSYLYQNKMHYAGAWSALSSYNLQDLVSSRISRLHSQNCKTAFDNAS